MSEEKKPETSEEYLENYFSTVELEDFDPESETASEKLLDLFDEGSFYWKKTDRSTSESEDEITIQFVSWMDKTIKCIVNFNYLKDFFTLKCTAEDLNEYEVITINLMDFFVDLRASRKKMVSFLGRAIKFANSGSDKYPTEKK